MKSISRALALLAAVLFIAATIPTTAQEAPMVAQGQLVRVDATAKTVSIRTAEGTQLQFGYNDKTKVTGSEDVAGLATMAGTQVAIRYVKQQQTNVAIEIEVLKKS